MKLKAGDIAPHFELSDIHGVVQTPINDAKQPTLLCFFRHAGCPPCNLRVRELMLAAQKLSRYSVRLLAVFESSVDHIRRDLAHGDVPFPILPDRERRLYAQYAVSPSLGGFLSSFLLRPQYSMKAIFKHGYIPKFSEATTMIPAEFLIASDGTIKLAYYGKDIGDYVPLEVLYKALDELSAHGRDSHNVDKVSAA